MYVYCNYATGQMSYTTPFLQGKACQGCPNSCSNGLCTCNKVCQNGGVLSKIIYELIINKLKKWNMLKQNCIYCQFKTWARVHALVQIILQVQNVRMLLVWKLTRNLVVGHPMRPFAGTATYLRFARICANVAQSLKSWHVFLGHAIKQKIQLKPFHFKTIVDSF